MLWTAQEKRKLRKQMRSGVPIKEVQIGDRTHISIRYQVYQLGLYIKRWKRSELTILEKLVSEGKKPWEIDIPGRTKIAIRNKAIRAEIWKPKRRHIHHWKTAEVRNLIHLVSVCGYTARSLFLNERFPGRSIDSISQQLRRLRRKNIII